MPRRAPRSRRQDTAYGAGPSDVATVVIGTDGSPTSWDAFCWGCGEARRLGGRAVAVFGQAEEDQASAEQVERLLEDMLRETVSQGLDLTFVHAAAIPPPSSCGSRKRSRPT